MLCTIVKKRNTVKMQDLNVTESANKISAACIKETSHSSGKQVWANQYLPKLFFKEVHSSHDKYPYPGHEILAGRLINHENIGPQVYNGGIIVPITNVRNV